MEKSSLTALARQELVAARQAGSGRSARTIYGGHEHVLRQTVIALAAGQTLQEHENPERRPYRCCTGGSAWPPPTSPGKGHLAIC